MSKWNLLIECKPEINRDCWISDGEDVTLAVMGEYSENWSNGDCWEDFEREYVFWMYAERPSPPGIDALPSDLRVKFDERLRLQEESRLAYIAASPESFQPSIHAEQERVKGMRVDDQWPRAEHLMAEAERPPEGRSL